MKIIVAFIRRWCEKKNMKFADNTNLKDHHLFERNINSTFFGRKYSFYPNKISKLHSSKTENSIIKSPSMYKYRWLIHELTFRKGYYTINAHLLNLTILSTKRDGGGEVEFCVWKQIKTLSHFSTSKRKRPKGKVDSTYIESRSLSKYSNQHRNR